MPTPHDHLFRTLFAKPDEAIGLLRPILPRAIAQRIDWSTLRPLPTNWVTRALGELRSDLVFEATGRGETSLLLHLLVEHQSRPDPRMPWRLSRYAHALLDAWLRQHPETLVGIPGVVPVVVYHGARPWGCPERLVDLIGKPDDVGEIRRLAPDIGYVLHDLSRIPDAHLRGSAIGRLGQVLLKHHSAGDLLPFLATQGPLVRSVMAARSGAEAWFSMLRYIMEVSSTPREAVEILEPLLKHPRERKIMLTAYDKLQIEGFNRGREEGREEGREKALRDAVVELARKRFGVVSSDWLQRIEATDSIALMGLLTKVGTADSIEAVFDDG